MCRSISVFLVILFQPLPVNASLGSPPAVFNCTCHYCSGQYWLVNDLYTWNTVNQNKGVKTFGPIVLINGSKLYTVTIPTSIALNGSTIQCLVYNGSNPHIESPVVKLLVQGNIMCCALNIQLTPVYNEIICHT